MNKEEYLRSVTPLTEAEIRDLLGAGLIGNLPKQTMSRVFATLADHAALIAKVREIAEGMEHDESCDAYDHDWIDWDEEGRPYCPPTPKCSSTCRRGKLLALCARGGDHG